MRLAGHAARVIEETCTQCIGGKNFTSTENLEELDMGGNTKFKRNVQK
jgi:hypothetical protein